MSENKKIKESFEVYWSASQQGLEVDKYGNLSPCKSETTQKGDERTKSGCGANTGDQSKKHPGCKGFAKGNTCAVGRGLADDEEKHLDDEDDENEEKEKYAGPAAAIPMVAGLAATAGAGYLGSKLAQKMSVEGGGDGVFKTTGPAQTCEFAETLGWKNPNKSPEGYTSGGDGEYDKEARDFIESKGYEIVDHDELADEEREEVNKNCAMESVVSDEDIDKDIDTLKVKFK